MGLSSVLGRRGERERQAFTLMLRFLLSVTVRMAAIGTEMANARGREVCRKKKIISASGLPHLRNLCGSQVYLIGSNREPVLGGQEGGLGRRLYFTELCVQPIFQQHEVPKHRSVEMDEEKAVATGFFFNHFFCQNKLGVQDRKAKCANTRQ